MADTNIEWADRVWNPIAGCSILSPGCSNCYAMKMAHRIEGMNAALGRPNHYAGLTKKTKAGAVWTGKVAVASDSQFLEPLRWKKPARVFVNSMADLFHEDVADEIIDRAFAVMALCPHLTFMVLTKRSKRMREYWSGPSGNISPTGFRCPRLNHILNVADRMSRHDHPAAFASLAANVQSLGKAGRFPNVWLGVSTEDQATADERIPHLLATPAAKRFISAEPLLGAIDIEQYICVFCKGSGWVEDQNWMPAYHTRPAMGRQPRDGLIPCGACNLGGTASITRSLGLLDWVIAGGESGPRARPAHPDWFRALRDRCAEAGVPFFFKQWGEWHGYAPTEQKPNGKWRDWNGGHVSVRIGKKAAGAKLAGVEHREFPT